MQELAPGHLQVRDNFWSPRLEANATAAIGHQWEQLEQAGCIDNFRLAAGEQHGFREGWFFADSDAFKWLDAACRVLASFPNPELRRRIDAFVGLISRAQTPEGYLYTYNQLHFPGQRWVNLQIEHELYCHGHLIEAGVSHYQVTGERDLLAVAAKAADLLVRELMDAGPDLTDGHEEIELALIKLYHTTGDRRYLALAERLIERRGRVKGFARLIFRQNRSSAARSRWVREQREQYLADHPERRAFRLPPGNVAKRTRAGRVRFRLSALSGQLLQQHRPVREQTVPVGHAVRFAYLETAAAMLARERGDAALVYTLEQAWDRMVQRRMYVTGGIGALPEVEGFGRDFELDPEVAYAETCAALGCLFWNWEMLLLTGRPRYADLFEWQLHNAAAVGMGSDGTSYLYNNPLLCRGGIARRPWFQVPCCPSNLSRTYASLGRYLLAREEEAVWIHQYVGCRASVNLGVPVQIELGSGLPWLGQVQIRVAPQQAASFTVHVRIPGWAGPPQLRVNGREVPAVRGSAPSPTKTASGYSPYEGYYVPIERTWSPGDLVEVELPMPIVLRRPDRRVRGSRGLASLTRGPLVYCLESTDNPGLDLFAAEIDPATLCAQPSPDHGGGLWVIRGRTVAGQEIVAIPYYAWANRGESQMTAVVRARR